jgi:hypothetical protein
MLLGTGYLSGENYPADTGMEIFFYPHTDTGNPTGKTGAGAGADMGTDGYYPSGTYPRPLTVME